MIHIRRARESDARGMAQVHLEAWQDAYRDCVPPGFLTPLSIDARESFWRDEVRALTPERRPWVAESAEEVVGFVCVGGARDETARPLTGEVYGLYVLPDCWDQGVGRNLLAHAVHDLNAHGYDDAVIWVPADNRRVRAFYEMEGWHPDGATKQDSLVGSEISEVRYRLALATSTVAEYA
jgi:ribosomal protein S18 acetylase RimI-like enzyme